MDQPQPNHEGQVGALLLVGWLQVPNILWRILFDVMSYAEVGNASRISKEADIMKETIYDILRSLNIEKNNFTQEQWIDFINELENNVEG